MTSSRTVTRRGANHTFHVIMTVLTMGAWGIFVWPIAAMLGRKTTVRHQGYPAAPFTAPVPPPVQRAPYALPQPVPNAVNPYNGTPYFDARQGLPPVEYPPSLPVWHAR